VIISEEEHARMNRGALHSSDLDEEEVDDTPEGEIKHYGILRRSGRYPWGSGGSQAARSSEFLNIVDGLRKEGLSEVEIARGFGMTVTQLRNTNTIAKNAKKQADIDMAQRLSEKGMSNIAIGRQMKINESSVRALLAPGQRDKLNVLHTTANMLREQVDAKGAIDIGTGNENYLGISKEKLATAVAILKDEGYKVHQVKVPQLGTNKPTTIKVLAKEEVQWHDLVKDPSKIKSLVQYSEDGGRSYNGISPPLQVNSKRIGIRYAKDGGADADGVIYVRPGVEDLSLGKGRYAQVRIAVDGTHYLKGMAMYRDDLPAGVDLLFNTNKNNTGNKLDAMKPIKEDEESPFGAIVRQIKSPDGKVTSAMNIVGGKEGMGEEGGWDAWSKTLSSQMLSKQSPKLAKSQLDMTYEQKRNDLDEIKKLTNPSVKKKLLQSYADDVDSSAVHLKAAHLPRQETKVILPINSLKENEIYAPTFRDGERVVLIRYPHGGVFEIPELTVNNRHPQAKKLIDQAPDAVGISHKVAAKLSGADFDGDTVLVIPNNHKKIKTKPPLEGLKGFDPQRAYPGYEGMTKMDARTKGREMGQVSNLITDMTIKGASDGELARAVRHSMVVIDAEKHGLDWKRSAIDNGIPQLKEKYQGKKNGGASTLISKATSPINVLERNPRPASKGGPIDPATGKKVFEPTGRSYVKTKVNKRTGAVTEKVIDRMERSQKLAETDNAHTLSSGTSIEKVYADHSNKLKSLANEARKELVHTKNIPYSPSAKRIYADQVASLSRKLDIAKRNAPLERQAQVIANAKASAKIKANKDLEASEIKKIKYQALTDARIRTGAEKQRINITPDEWAAIQAGAITSHRLKEILDNTDDDVVKQLATPKSKVLMTNTKKQRAQIMLAGGYTQAEIADALGVSVSTLKRSLGE
jgi:DNA-binding CsgD family transcriptional regulator